MATVRKLARITAAEGRSDALRAALLDLEAATRREPGCREFAFFQALSDPGSFVLLEEFEDARALADHMARPYTRDFFALGVAGSVSARDI